MQSEQHMRKSGQRGDRLEGSTVSKRPARSKESTNVYKASQHARRCTSTRNTAVNVIHKIPVLLEFASQMLPRREPDSSRGTSNSGCLAMMKQWTGLLHTLQGFLIQRAHGVGHQLQVSSYSHFSLLGWTPNQDHPWECSRGQVNPIRQGEHPFPCAGNSGPRWPGVWNGLQARHPSVLSPEDSSGTEHSGL